jgi:hypothetical protein
MYARTIYDRRAPEERRQGKQTECGTWIRPLSSHFLVNTHYSLDFDISFLFCSIFGFFTLPVININIAEQTGYDNNCSG